MWCFWISPGRKRGFPVERIASDRFERKQLNRGNLRSRVSGNPAGPHLDNLRN